LYRHRSAAPLVGRLLLARPEVPVRQSWLSPLAQRRPAGVKGMGIFAVDAIPAGVTVAGFGGSVVDRAELDALDEEIRIHALQIDDDLFIASAPPFDDADFVNHSCDPNCGIVGSVLLVTMRGIEAGEELCFDYAMTDSDDYDEFECSCGTSRCRGTVTGADWKEPELRDRYRGWCSAYITRRSS
jgi:uncharacterized protein